MSHTAAMPRQLIITADDFGRSASVNAAVIRAHREGCLTAASLMVAGEAFAEAVALAKATPTLQVGLHVVCIDGAATLPATELPDLVDGRGWFPAQPVALGTKCYFSRRAQAQLQRELRAQFARFAATGLPLSHVDGHWHFHLHPTVFPMVVALAEEFGAPRLRVPRDDFWSRVRRDRKRLLWKLVTALEFAWLNRRAARYLATRNSPLITPDQCFGLFDTGGMDEAALRAALARAQDGLVEIYLHPDLVNTAAAPNGPRELEALLRVML